MALPWWDKGPLKGCYQNSQTSIHALGKYVILAIVNLFSPAVLGSVFTSMFLNLFGILHTLENMINAMGHFHLHMFMFMSIFYT